MKFFIRVKTQAGEQSIEEFGDHRYLIHLKSRPENNEANIELLKLFAKHIGVPSTKLKIISGASSKDKILESFC
jgi:uncharacterized protein YggU (UPF0235/DUF167 family)